MLADLFSRLEKGGRLPTPPGVVLRLLELTRRTDVSVKEIADTIAMDPGLSAKILRFVNSPMAGVGREVTSLTQAVSLTGIRGVKMMALSFSVLSGGGAKICPGFDSHHFALQSLTCGVAARVLAALTKTGSAQEAFVGGLLSQLGRSALASGLPEVYAQVLASAEYIPRDLPALEEAALGGTYPQIGGQLLRAWGIPESLCRAVETFRTLEDGGEATWLAQILEVAELAAGVVCPDRRGRRLEANVFLEAAHSRFGLEPDAGTAALAQVSAEVEQTRVMLELTKGRLLSGPEIETEIRERITELSMAMHLENQSMARQQEDLLRRATTDPLTGVGNRAAFDARLSLEIERLARSAAPLALLMIDVDKFKAFNDTHGHLAGDRVLQAVARVLDENIRKIDYLARFGGEEFAVVAPGTAAEGAVFLAERLRTSVQSLALQWEGRDLKITISVGVGLLTEMTEVNAAATLIRAADEQLYAAKCAGRNQVAFAGPKRAARAPTAVRAR